jgi:SAM-dependent methyltransferase
MSKPVVSILKSYPCPLCGTARSRVVQKKTGVAVPVEFTIVTCVSCRHIRVDPRIPDEDLDALYDAEYYRGHGFDRTIDYTAPSSPESRAEKNAIIDTVAEALGRSVEGVRWLDVGCGSGGLLEEARRRGALTFGVDSSPFAAAHCAKKGLALLSDAEVRKQKGSFDVVSAIDVIEHVPDPRALLEHLRSCATAGGILYVHTGNWNLVRRQPGTPYLMPEGHIQYFTPDAMRRLFAESSIAEADVVNRTWFVDRHLPKRVRRVVPPAALRGLAKLARRLTPGLAPFPVGRTH